MFLSSVFNLSGPFSFFLFSLAFLDFYFAHRSYGFFGVGFSLCFPIAMSAPVENPWCMTPAFRGEYLMGLLTFFARRPHWLALSVPLLANCWPW